MLFWKRGVKQHQTWYLNIQDHQDFLIIGWTKYTVGSPFSMKIQFLYMINTKNLGYGSHNYVLYNVKANVTNLENKCTFREQMYKRVSVLSLDDLYCDIWILFLVYREDNQYGCRVSKRTSCDLYPDNVRENAFNPGRMLTEGKHHKTFTVFIISLF